MTTLSARFATRCALLAGLVVLSLGRVNAESRVLDGHPVSLTKAQSWCIAPGNEMPSWDAPSHPECKMVWRVLAERDGRVLYSARYAWPSPRRGGESWRVLSEVLFEGVKGSKVVHCLYAVQEDEARILLAPLTVVEVGDGTILESRVCMSGTTECGSEFARWSNGRVDKIEDHSVPEIRSQLPKGYDLSTNPKIDLAQLSGEGKASTKGDAECCPSATIAFKVRLEGTELHVEELKFKRERSTQ
jgi:hypothetical protein